MKVKSNVVKYKTRREDARNGGNLALALYYQILIIQEIKSSGFYFRQKNDLRQHKDILREMFDEIIGVSDLSYRKGIYYEVILSGGGIPLSVRERECLLCSSLFQDSQNQEYVHGIYQIHISAICKIAQDDVEAAQIYAGNLLTLLEIRYGTNSWQYAKMLLHIIGEYYYFYRKEAFLLEFPKNYDYLKRYTLEKDEFFADTLLNYVFSIEKTGDPDYEIWMTRCVEIMDKKHESSFYYLWKCREGWIKADALEKQNRDKEALQVLQKTIKNYVNRSCDNINTFYAYCDVYSKAASICRRKNLYNQMLSYAQDGLALCKIFNQVGSEFYYNLYNFIGIWHMWRGDWRAAENLYGNSVSDIKQTFGKENENYMYHLSNLADTAINQGKDASLYFKELKSIQDKDLQKKVTILLNNQLNNAIANGYSLDDIELFYKKCIKNTEENEQERKRLDTCYLATRILAGKIDGETEFLIKKLFQSYYDSFEGDLALSYWNSRMLWEWQKEDVQEALRICEILFQKLQEAGNGKETQIAANYIQLLILNGQYKKAKDGILSMIERIDSQILDIGFGNNFQCLLIMRILLSMYIHILKKECPKANSREVRFVLEKVIRCKTIDREIKSLLGKYDCGDGQEKGQMDMFYFKRNHRMMAALEFGKNAGRQNENYEKQKMACLLELAKHEASLNEKIPFRELVHTFKFEEITVPDNAVCVEYFSYYNFQDTVPMLGADPEKWTNGGYSYFVFVLLKEAGQVKILDIIDIPFDNIWEEKAFCLLDATEKAEGFEREKTEAAIGYLNQVFAEPVLKHLKEREKVYLGLDFILQYLPIDLIFSGSQGELMDIILVDSVCYAGEDSRINIQEGEALIIGNPQISLLDEGYNRLPCGELESFEVARMTDARAYIGKEAKQKLLWKKGTKALIHIDTHGELIDVSEEKLLTSNLLVNSYLTFAGYKDWLKGRREEEFGNGIISGDDFLFMDLSKTRLVVLSACMSSLGYVRGQENVHGMRWAIGVAGAENSVTTLWNVVDDASAVLMILFYRNLRHMPVGEALCEAKRCIQAFTIRDLKKDPVLWEIAVSCRRASSDDKGTENDRPYEHWRYWAGFVCYHR